MNQLLSRCVNRNALSVMIIVALFAGQVNAAKKGRTEPRAGYSRFVLIGVGTALVAGAAFVANRLLGAPPADPDTPESLKESYSAYFGPKVVISATAILRFPHMLSDLMDEKEKLASDEKPDILILGAGIHGNKFGTEVPFVHEIAGVFPASHIEVVDLDPRVDLALKNSRYGEELQRNLASAVIENDRNFMRFKKGPKHELAKHSRSQLKKLLKNMPLELNSLLGSELSIDVKEIFFEFHEPKKYDFIIATKSLLYPLVRDSASETTKRVLVEKYFGALNENGKLYVDMQTFILLQSDGLFDAERFDHRIIEHTSNYLESYECVDKVYASYDYIACLSAKNGHRVSTTEDIVVITRKK